MKVTLRLMGLVTGLLFFNLNAWAQPANDDCADAFEVIYSDDEATAVLVAGDTRGGTASTEPTTVCSGSWYTDDIWFTFTTPAVLPPNGIVVKCYFNNATNPTDVPAVGMALYENCDPATTAIACFSSDVPEDNSISIPGACLVGNQSYVVRVWSTGNTTATEGTLELGVFANTQADVSLWCETFAGGIEVNGWSTEGTCAVADSNINAGWKYLPDGLLDKGAYIFVGAGISSPTLCDGAVGVDSDFDDNGGIEGNFGAGPCPAPAQHILISPEIATSEWDAAGVSLTWNQALRQFQSTYFVSFRTKDGDEEWSEWTDFQVNTEFATNGDFNNTDVQRIFLTGAAGHDFLQIRFVYNANYYMWGIDDVCIVETECSNIRAQDNFFAIAPWATIPENQVYPFCALNDILNAGACPQTNVVLNHTVEDSDSGQEIYNEDLAYGTIAPTVLAENVVFPELITLPSVPANYTATYTVTSDSLDFDVSDNTITFTYGVGGNTFGHEDGFTRSVAVANGVYDEGAPLSYAYGNYFKPVADATVQNITWGVNNPADMAGKVINVYLLQWTDNNGNQVAENGERRFVGFAEYLFDGNEGDNAILETELENFENPGEDVVMRGGFGYIAMIEYVASTADDPQFFMLASEARNYNAQVLGMDSAFVKGIADDRVFISVLGHSPDGVIANIDYEVTELDVNDNRIFFGNDIVPLVRVVVDPVNTNDPLPSNNLVNVYPNPAKDQIRVDMDFVKDYSDVIIRMLDNLGRPVMENRLSQVAAQHVETLNVHALSAGNYMLQVITEDGQRSTPVVIVK